jgi:ATP-dependent Clp protease ATP-binding subunit ClpA
MGGSDVFHRSPDARADVLAAAQACARRRGEGRIGTDHLLIGVVTSGNEIARRAGLSVEGLHEALDRLDGSALCAFGIETASEALLASSPVPGPPSGRRRPHRGIPGRHLPLSAGARRSLKKSLRLALDHRHRRINTNHLLAALATGGHNDPAVRLLKSSAVDPADLESAVQAELRDL